MPEITTITSEALQAEVRRLLPSQRGFGNDLEAQNVIVPVVDLTPTAEGSALREDLQTAASFGGVTTKTKRVAGSETVQNTPGFYKYNATLSVLSAGTADQNQASVLLNDGSSDKVLHRMRNNSDGTPEEPNTISVTGTIFLRTGDSLQINVTGSDGHVSIAAWPIADVNGNLINPTGFSFE
tara:strand:- start:126 stop:671 length:546 start_codon:yes stop_codon:yes gene_type:complete